VFSFPVVIVTSAGSCRRSGYQGCCSAQSTTCGGSDGLCMCDSFCYAFGDCCSDISEVCTSSQGSCIVANYTSCCTSGECFGSNAPSCKCDEACRSRDDCCPDIDFSCRKNEALLLFRNIYCVFIWVILYSQLLSLLHLLQHLVSIPIICHLRHW